MIKIALSIALYFGAGIFILNVGIQNLTGTLLKIGKEHIKPVLLKYTKNTLTSFFSGFVLSVLLQGSTPVMLCVISLINSGMMSFYNSLGIVYGANLGTTLTAVLMTYQTEFLKVIVLSVGLLMKCFIRKGKLSHMGDLLIAIGLIFFGISVLNLSMPLFRDRLLLSGRYAKYGENVLGHFGLSVFITGVTHSSAAVTAVTILLFKEGIVGKAAVIAIVLGSNLGSCLTTQIASYNTGREAVKMAWAHTLYNFTGSVAGLLLITPLCNLLDRMILQFSLKTDFFPALCHIMVNLISAMVFIPITKPYYLLINKLVGEDHKDF